MTNEEAQELIAEIDEALVIPVSREKLEGFSDGLMFEQDRIKKIINRFANKPPYMLPTYDADMTITLREFKCDYQPEFVSELSIRAFHPTSDKVITVRLTLNDVKQLHANINKMLRWLENEQ